MVVLLFVLLQGATPLRTVELREDLAVGAVDHPHLAFSTISDLAVSPDGRIFVAQPMDGSIIVLSRMGEFLEVLGRKGRGPGEFEQVSSLQYWRGGVVVTDYRLRRTTTLAAVGDVRDLQHAPATVPNGLIPLPPQARLGDGAFLGFADYRPLDSRPTALPLMVIRGGEYRAILAHLAYGDQAVRVVRPGLVTTIRQPVSSHSLWEAFPDGRGAVVVHRPSPSEAGRARFTVEMFDTAGASRYRRTFAYTPEAVPAEFAERERARLVDHVASRRPFPRELIADVYAEGYRVPAFQAAVDQVVASSNEEVWLRRGAYGRGVAEWLLLNADGRLVARTRLDARITLMAATADHVYGTRLSGNDVPQVVRFQIIRND